MEWTKDGGGRWKPEEMPGTEKYYPAELVFLALGFLGPQKEALEALGVNQDAEQEILNQRRRGLCSRRLSPWPVFDCLGYKVSTVDSLSSSLV